MSLMMRFIPHFLLHCLVSPKPKTLNTKFQAADAYSLPNFAVSGPVKVRSSTEGRIMGFLSWLCRV